MKLSAKAFEIKEAQANTHGPEARVLYRNEISYTFGLDDYN